MRRVLLGRIAGGAVCVEEIDGTPVTEPLRSRDVLLVSRADCMVLTPETGIPVWRSFLSRSKKRTFVAREYPGPLEGVVYDQFRRRAGGRTSIHVVVLPRSSVELYWARAGSASLSLLSAVIRPVRRRETVAASEHVCITFEYEMVTEVMTFSRGLLRSSVAAMGVPEIALQPRTDRASLRLERGPNLNRASDPGRNPAVASVNLDSRLPRRLPSGRLFESMRPGGVCRRLVRYLRSLALILLAANFLLVGLLSPLSTERLWRSDPEPVAETALITKEPAATEEVESLKAELSALLDLRPRSLYGILEEIRRAAVTGSRLDELHLRGDELTLSLHSPDPMDFVDRLSNSPLFGEVVLQETGPTDRSSFAELSAQAKLR